MLELYLLLVESSEGSEARQRLGRTVRFVIYFIETIPESDNVHLTSIWL